MEVTVYKGYRIESRENGRGEVRHVVYKEGAEFAERGFSTLAAAKACVTRRVKGAEAEAARKEAEAEAAPVAALVPAAPEAKPADALAHVSGTCEASTFQTLARRCESLRRALANLRDAREQHARRPSPLAAGDVRYWKRSVSEWGALVNQSRVELLAVRAYWAQRHETARRVLEQQKAAEIRARRIRRLVVGAAGLIGLAGAGLAAAGMPGAGSLAGLAAACITVGGLE